MPLQPKTVAFIMASNQEQLFSCDNCDFKTYTDFGLKLHKSKAHRVELEHKCDQCQYSTKTLKLLMNHNELKHINGTQFECNICEKKFKYRVNLNHHKKRKHGGLKFKCEFCEFETTFKHILQKHTNALHTKEIEYSCNLCDFKTYSASSFINHTSMHNPKERKYKCDDCDYSARKKGHLKDHYERIHINIKRYKCELCEFAGKTQRDVRIHKNYNHKDNHPLKKCTDCGYTSQWDSNIKRHFKQIHQNAKEFHCEICGKDFTAKHNYQSHQLNVHNIGHRYETHKCTYCEYETIKKNLLTRHIKTKHEDMPTKCELCDSVLKNSETLKNHVRLMHKADRKIYQCHACPKEFIKLETMKDHFKTVHEKAPKEVFECFKCSGVTYATRTGLRMHVKKEHEGGLSIHYCTECNYSSPYLSTLKRHKKQRHSIIS